MLDPPGHRPVAGFDFSGHRPGTLERRLQSRMILLGIASVPDYLIRLRAEPEEAGRGLRSRARLFAPPAPQGPRHRR